MAKPKNPIFESIRLELLRPHPDFRVIRAALRGYMRVQFPDLDPEDPIQTISIKYSRANQELQSKGDEKHQRAWLKKVAVNHCIDLKRKHTRRKEGDPLDPSHPAPEGESAPDPKMSELLDAWRAAPHAVDAAIWDAYRRRGAALPAHLQDNA